MTWKATNPEYSMAFVLGNINGVECKLQSLFKAGVHDSKEQAGKIPAGAHAEAPLMCLWVRRQMTSTSHPQNFLHQAQLLGS